MHVDVDPLARGRPLGQALDRGTRPVLVQRGWAQLDDERAQARDLLCQVLNGGLDRRAQLLLTAAPRRGEPDAQAGKALQRLVVQLAGPAPALLLGGLNALAQPLLLDRLAGGHCRRGAGRERAEEAFVFAIEARIVAEMVKGGEDADRAAAERERHQQRGVGLEAEQLLRDVQRRARVRQPLGALRPQHLPRDRALDRHVLAVGARRELAGAGRVHELLLVLEHDHERAGADEGPRPRDDQLEDAVEVRLSAERLRDRHCGVERAHGSLEVIAAALDGRVQPRVVDRDRGPVGEDHRGLLISRGERLAAVLLRQVEVAPHLVADHDRDAQERLHLGMRVGEAARARVLTEVLEPERPRLLDQQPEDAATAGQLPDPRCVSSSMPAVTKRSSSLRRSSSTPTAA